jgi:hypothetical protein
MRQDLGRVDLCLNVKDIHRSHEFYRTIGMRKVGGNVKQKWLILAHGEFRLGLYQGYIGGTVINFRGGHVGNIVRGLEARGLKPYGVRGLRPSGRGSASVKDPDGHVIFFDTSPQERAARVRSRKR